MPSSVLSAVQIAVACALVAWMITGFTPLPGRWLRWKMFCRATFTIVSLTGTTKDGRTEPVNVYDHLSPGSTRPRPAHRPGANGVRLLAPPALLSSGEGGRASVGGDRERAGRMPCSVPRLVPHQATFALFTSGGVSSC